MKSDKPALTVIGFLSGFVATPISIAFTPVGIVADVVIGIAEAVFLTYKGANNKAVQELIFKKIILSPAHQTLSVIAKITIFVILPICWPFSYAGSQSIITILPDYLNHKKMNIFINGGITDKDSTKTAFDNWAKSQPVQN